MYGWEDDAEEGLWEEDSDADAAIADEINSVLLERLTFELQPIDVNVSYGAVTLRGIVRTRELRNVAAALAESVPGVREVINQIEVTH